jgi:cell wall-associated NlpC family hydrolase
MAHDRHIRRLLWAALLSGTALASRYSPHQPSRSFALSTLSASSSTRARGWPIRDTRAPRLFEGFALPQTLRDSVVRLARAQVGSRYVFGGTSPHGFDCSGLVRYVVSHVQLTLPRTARQQALVGAPVGRDRLQPGDILTFGHGARVSHIGIYVGSGKYVHASSVAGRVIVSPIDRPPSRLVRPLSGARRLLAFADQLDQRLGSN